MPSSPPAWITDARTAVERATNEKEFHTRLEALIEVDNTLSRLIDSLDEFTTSTALGSATWWTGVDIPDMIFAEIAAVRKGIGSRQWARLRTHLDQLLPDIRAEVRQAWQGYVSSRAGGTEDLQGLARVLEGVPGLAGIANNFGEVLGEISRLRRKLPDARAVDAVETATTLLDDLAARLPDEVKVFVTAVARGNGAPLDLLSPEVLAWLNANGATGEFRIVVAGRRMGS